LQLCALGQNFSNIAFVTHLPEDGHKSGRNMYEA